MATLQKLRNKGPLLVIFVGLALFAFIASAAGNRFDDETYGNTAKFAFFWSADDSSEGVAPGSARVWYLTSKSMAFGYMSKPKNFGFSVRCVR